MSQHSHSNPFMKAALKEAELALTRGEVPIGAVIVDSKNSEIIARSGNSIITDHNPIAHAEIVAIQQACQKIGSERLPECDLYTTLEPCPMCAQAIAFARIRRLYFGAYDPKGGGVEHGPRIFHSSSCHHQPEIYGGIQESNASELLKAFFQKKR